MTVSYESTRARSYREKILFLLNKTVSVTIVNDINAVFCSATN